MFLSLQSAENSLTFNIFTHEALQCNGNPAGVTFSESEPTAAEMQALAAQRKLPAISYLWPAEKEGHYRVRWFAPDMEIELCGHGALAAFAWLKKVKQEKKAVLHYPFGKISGGWQAPQCVYMATQAIPITRELPLHSELQQGLGIALLHHFATANKNIVVAKSEEELRSMKPDFEILRKLPYFGYSVTARSSTIDFVSRTIIPKTKQLEDFATGSSHAALIPYWQPIFKKHSFEALQLSSRGGYFIGELKNADTVILRGNYTIE